MTKLMMKLLHRKPCIVLVYRTYDGYYEKVKCQSILEIIKVYLFVKQKINHYCCYYVSSKNEHIQIPLELIYELYHNKLWK